MPGADLSDEALREIGRFVSAEIDLWDLDAWLSARTLNLPHDDPAFPLSREVFLLFAEVTSGHRAKGYVRSKLSALADVDPQTVS